MEERMTLRAIAERVGGRPVGDGDRVVSGVASPTNGREGDIVCLWNLEGTASTAGENRLAGPGEGVLYLADAEFFARNPGCEGVSTDDPKRAFPLLLSLFAGPRRSSFGSSGVHPSAVVSDEADVHPTAWVGPLCVVEAGTSVGEGAFLQGRVYVGRGCSIGPGSVLEAGAVLFERVRIGSRCVIHGNSVLGSDGFGVPIAPDGCRPERVPQLGGVVLGDDVEVGACTTIDRGTLDDTVVGSGTKIDNHVHIAHNVRVGENCIIVAMTGLAGSAVLEDGVVMAARSGVKEHVRVGRGAIVAAQGGVIGDVPPGEVVSGFPARPHRENFRVQAAMQRLPELLSRVKRLEKELDAFRAREVDGRPEGADE